MENITFRADQSLIERATSVRKIPSSCDALFSEWLEELAHRSIPRRRRLAAVLDDMENPECNATWVPASQEARDPPLDPAHPLLVRSPHADALS